MGGLGLHADRFGVGLSVTLCILTPWSLGFVGAKGDVMATWGRTHRRGVTPPYTPLPRDRLGGGYLGW